MIKNIIFLGIWLFLFSCDDPLKLGLQLQSQNELLKTLVSDTNTIICSTEILEQIETRYANTLLTGEILDSKFGNLTAASYFKLTNLGSLTPLEDTINFFNTDKLKPIYDSAQLLLRIKGQNDIYGDTTKAFTVNFHELAEKMDTSRVYVNSDELKTGKLLGTKKFYGYFSGARYFQVKLDDQFGKALMEKTQGKNQYDLDKLFNGFKLSANGNCVIGFDNDPNNLTVSRLQIFCHYLPTDTLSYSRSFYFLGNQSARWYNYAQTDLKNTQFLQKLSPTNPLSSKLTEQKTYVQAGTGLVTKLTFPFLSELAKNQKVIINHAILSFEVAEETFPNINQNPSESLIFYYVDNNGRISRNANGGLRPIRIENSPTGSELFYISSGRTYQPAVLTTFVQNVINGKENPSIIIQSGRFASSVSKTLIQDSSPSNPKKMKLTVYYTVFK